MVKTVEISDPEPKPEAAAAPAADAAAPAADADEDDEGFGMSDVLLDSVTKDEWKSIEAALSHHKKVVAEMLKRCCAQVRTKGELVLDESNGRFLGDMLPEKTDFATWAYKVRLARRFLFFSAAVPARVRAATPVRAPPTARRAPRRFLPAGARAP